MISRIARTPWRSTPRTYGRCCTLTRVPDAIAVQQFLAGHSVIARPDGDDLDTYGRQVVGNLVGIVPLLARDEGTGAAWSRFYQRHYPQMAEFDADNGWLVIRAFVPCSPLIKGLLLFHEGYHAMTHTLNPYDSQHEETFNFMERETYDRQNHILVALGGNVYAAALRAEVDRLSDLGVGDGIGEMDSVREYYPVLDEVFGPPDSDIERDYRRTFFWIQAKFAVVEQQFPSDCDQRKLTILHSFHRRTGVWSKGDDA